MQHARVDCRKGWCPDIGFSELAVQVWKRFIRTLERASKTLRMWL